MRRFVVSSVIASSIIAASGCGSDEGATNAAAGGYGDNVGGATSESLGGASSNGGTAVYLTGGTDASTTGGSSGTSSTLAVPAGSRLGAYMYGTCALNSAGKMLCWGGLPPSTSTITPSSSVFTRLSAGWEGACGITNAGKIECFTDPSSNGWRGSCGADESGVLRCSNDPEFETAGVTLSETWAKTTGGGAFVCGITREGLPSCVVTFVQPPPNVTFTDIAAGEHHGCGIRQDTKELLCWSRDYGAASGCTDPSKLGQSSPPAGQFAQVVSGWYHSCGLRLDGTVTCWGAGDPNDTTGFDSCSVPQRYNFGQGRPPPGAFKSISAGFVTTCGVKTDGTLACWGAGTGASSSECSSNVDACGQALPPSGTFVEVSVGSSHACAMTAAGQVKCWGSNTGGRATPPAELQ